MSTQIKNLEEKRLEVTDRLEQLMEISDDRRWSDEEEDQVKRLSVSLKEVNEKLTAERAAIKKQQKLASSIHDQIKANTRRGSNNDSVLVDGIQGTQQVPVLTRYGSDEKEPTFVTFRNGKVGQYTNVDAPHILENNTTLPVSVLQNDKYVNSFRHVIRTGSSDQEFKTRLQTYWNECCPEANATPSDFTSGGFMLAPMQFVSGLQKCCDRQVIMRQLANVITVTQATRLGIRRLDDRLASFAWGCECEKPKSCAAPGGEVKELEPHHWTQCTSICNALMLRATQNVEQILQEELARDLRENLEYGYLYGSGQQQPLGILHPKGLSSEQDFEVKKGALSPRCLLKMACSLASCVDAVWLMSRKAYCDILESTNGTQDYYWWNLIVQSGPGTGTQRPSLLGYPVFVSEIATGSFDQVGDYPAVLGDFNSYYIADGPTVGLKRAEDIFQNTTCWVARGYTDGMVVNDCDFVRAKVVATE